MSITTGQPTAASDFINNSQRNATPANDAGRVPKLESDGKLHANFISMAFAGVRAIQTSGDTTGTTLSLLTFTAEDFDTDGFHDNATNPGRITIPSGMGGTYLIGASAEQTASRDQALKIKVNGTTEIAGNSAEGFVAAAPVVSVTTIYALAAGDYIEVYTVSSSAGATTGNTKTNFWAYKVG